MKIKHLLHCALALITITPSAIAANSIDVIRDSAMIKYNPMITMT